MRPHRSSAVEIDSPRALRLRRLARQRASCGCALVVVIGLGLLVAVHRDLADLFHRRIEPAAPQAALFPLAVTVKNPSVARYDLVAVTARTFDASGKEKPLHQPPTLTILREKEPQATVGHVDRMVMQYDHHMHCYVAHWPVPWNATLGEYTVDVRAKVPTPEKWDWGAKVSGLPPGAKTDDRWSECVAQSRLVVSARKPEGFSPGTCVVTWEDHPPTGDLRRPDGSMGGPDAIFDWARFMGADTVWVRGAVTEVRRGETLSMKHPFVDDETAIHNLAREAHRRGLKFGTWAVAFETLPHSSNAGKPPYKFSQIVGRDGSSHDSDFISLLDPDRPRQLAAWLRKMAEDPNIDMVGLDYFRPDSGGYEAAAGFLHNMPLTLPAALAKKTAAQRRAWVADMIDRKWRLEPDFYEEWKWYQSHLVAQDLHKICDLAGLGELHKPLWVFTFGWLHGLQSGQDPLMLTDAGADGLAVMLYQLRNVQQFDQMVGQWSGYVRQGEANLLPGDTVDFGLHQRLTHPVAAPEEMYRRIVTAALRFSKGGPQVGAFWHDISRAIKGNIGPYPGTEWALAGAAAFTTLREAWKVYPLKAAVSVPSSAVVGSTFEVRLTIKNLSRKPVRGLTLKLEKTADIECSDKREIPLAEVPAGGETVVPWHVRIKDHNHPRGDRFMIACRVNWPDGDYGAAFRRDLPRTIVVMKYVNGL